MQNNSLANISMQSNIVLVAAWGAGMSSIVGILHDLGFENLVALDGTASQLTRHLEDKWVNMIIWHGKYEVQPHDWVIYSVAAVDSIEVQQMKKYIENAVQSETKVKTPKMLMSYFQFLWEVSKYFSTIGFAWTNGKSTSTSLAIHVAKQFVPSFGLGVLGALVPDFWNQNYVINQKVKWDLQAIFMSIFSHKGSIDYDLVKKYSFFVESCEYKRHFLNLDLDYVIITNIHLDHTDYFKDFDDYLWAYEELISNVRKKVYVLENNPEYKILSEKFPDKVEWVEVKKYNFQYLLGEHQNCNGSLVEAVCKPIIADKFPLTPLSQRGDIRMRIENFKGLWRRMEPLMDLPGGAMLYSDYGHVAESIYLWFDALKNKFPDKKLIVLFQPHQMNRVAREWNEFVVTLKKYDEVIIYDIYAAREHLDDIKLWREFLQNINSIQELWLLFAQEAWGSYLDKFDDLSSKLVQYTQDTIVVVYTAGDLDYDLRKWLKMC